MNVPFQPPRVLAWEVTRRCPLACKHCRAGAANIRYEHELTTDECRRVIDSLARTTDHEPRTTNHAPRTMIIWTGGEPMLQGKACIELLRMAKASGVTTAVETSGFFAPDFLPALAEATDYFLWDFKDSDPDRHRRYVGSSNERILENLRLLDQYPVNICLRCIMVEGVNMTQQHAEAIAALFASLKHCRGVELLPYHAYGASKAVQAGIAAPPHREWIPSAERLRAFSDALIARGVTLCTG